MTTIADVEAELVGARKNAWSSLVLLLVSLAAFVASGLFDRSLKSVALIVVILLVHESGHWLGMRLFGYRDLRMLFIPFFGAAVTGKEDSVSTVRKGIVDLLGPVPGIVFGMAAILVATRWSHPFLATYGVMSLFLNGFNLLPIPPLDGGNLCDRVLFSRHPKAEIAFRVLAAAAFLALGIRLNSRAFIAIGVFSMLMIREIHCQQRIVGRLDESHLNLPPTEDGSIPHEWLEANFQWLSLGLSERQATTKALASRARAVWKRCRRRPAGLGQSLALLGVYLGSLAVVGMGVAFAVYMAHGNAKLLKHDYAGAVADYSHALALDSQSSAGLESRGFARMSLGDSAGALADFDRAILLNSKDALALGNRGELKVKKGDYAGAISDCDRALALKPDLALALMGRGGARLSKGDLAGSFADFDRVVVLMPKNADAIACRGTVRFRKGDYLGALVDLDRAISLSPDSPFYLLARAAARYRTGNFTGTIDDCDRALVIAPDNVAAFRWRSAARNQLHFFEQGP